MLCDVAIDGCDNNRQHGYFTEALLHALKDRRISSGDIRSTFFGAVTDCVKTQSGDRQRPHMETTMTHGFAFRVESGPCPA